MTLFENIRIAWEGVRANKMRALLTMLGIIIGIASVIGILTVGGGLSKAVTGQMGSLGASNINIMVQQREGGVSRSMTNDDRITEDMIAALRERYPGAVKYVSLSRGIGSGKAQDGSKYANVSVTAVNTEYLDANNITLLKGRQLSQKDMDGQRQVAVVSDRLVNNLFGGDAQAALGRDVVIYAGSSIYTFSIVGVYQYEASVANFSLAPDKDVTTAVYIPLTTGNRLRGSTPGYSSFMFVSGDDTDSAAFAAQAANFLNKYYKNNDAYRVAALSMETMLSVVGDMMDTLSIAISVIAGISLLVGGIGVMNIMLVSVTERTREIGTRKAIGATNAQIRVQFVVESMIICLIGGVIGILTGAALGYVGSSLLDMPSLPRASYVILAVGFSMAIGVFFGYYPANKAARLDPIEALRYE